MKRKFYCFSWVVFWINVKLTAERVAILITLILAQVVLIFGVAGQFPSVSDVKAVDIYLIVNFLFNVGVLVESIIAAKLGQSVCVGRVNNQQNKDEVTQRKVWFYILEKL